MVAGGEEDDGAASVDDGSVAPVTLGLGEDEDAVQNVAAETMDATACSIPS